MQITRISAAVRPSSASRVIAVAASMLGASLLAGPVLALDEGKSEKEVLNACAKQLCDIVSKKDASGPDLSCNLTKTWSKTSIQAGIETKKMSWGFGDARCTIDVHAKRAAIVDALSKPDQTFEFDSHTINCSVEREKEVTEVKISLAPRIQFKDGKAQKAWVAVKDIDAPTVVKGVIWSAAKIEDNLGVFHSEMLSEINEFIGQKCPKMSAAN